MAGTQVGSIYYDLDLDTKDFTTKLDSSQKSIGAFSKVAEKQKDSWGAFSKVVAGASVAVGLFAANSVKAYFESETANSQLNAVLASTGGIAGVTSKSAIQLAKSLQNVTAFSDETVMSAESLLLTFTKISSDIFPQATEMALDMSQALGVDVKESSIQLGKALQDPILGVTALRRVGVDFNEQAQKMIKNMVESGHSAQAQQFIMNELNTEFGKSARMFGMTVPGQLKILQNHFNDVQETIGKVIALGIAPIVQKAGQFVAANQNLVVSLAITAIAVVGFAASLVAVVGAAGLLITILGGPLTLIVLALSALLGVVVFKAAGKLQDKMADLTKGFDQGSKFISQSAKKNLADGAGGAASDLTKKLADIDAQIKKSNSQFTENLAEMVKSARKRVVDIKNQIDDETATFVQSEDDKKRAFQQSQAEMNKDHQRNVVDNKTAVDQENADYKLATQAKLDDYAKKIDAEKQVGTSASRAKIADLQDQLQKELTSLDASHTDKITKLQLTLQRENEDYTAHYQEVEQQYQQDTDRAKAEHDKKLIDLQNSLNEQQDMLNRHNAEVNAVQDFQYRDDITKLVQSHQDQLAEYQKQKNDVIANAGQMTSGIAGQLNSLPSKINGDAFKLQGQAVGDQMGGAFVDAMKGAIDAAFKDSVRNPAARLWDDFKNFFNNLSDMNKGGSLFKAGTTLKLSDFLHFADGGNITGGQPAIIGERGPELFIPRNSGTIIPNKSISNYRNSNVVINQTNNINKSIDLDAANKELGWRLAT